MLDGGEPRVVTLDIHQTPLDFISVPWFAIQRLVRLEELGLWDTGVVGEMSSVLCDLVHLQVLTVSRNRLRGSIPSCMSTLPDLHYIWLSANDLSGNIPEDSALGNMLKNAESTSLEKNHWAPLANSEVEALSISAVELLGAQDAHVRGTGHYQRHSNAHCREDTHDRWWIGGGSAQNGNREIGVRSLGECMSSCDDYDQCTHFLYWTTDWLEHCEPGQCDDRQTGKFRSCVLLVRCTILDYEWYETPRTHVYARHEPDAAKYHFSDISVGHSDWRFGFLYETDSVAWQPAQSSGEVSYRHWPRFSPARPLVHQLLFEFRVRYTTSSSLQILDAGSFAVNDDTTPSVYSDVGGGFCTGPAGVAVNGRRRDRFRSESDCAAACSARYPFCVGFSVGGSTEKITVQPMRCVLYGAGLDVGAAPAPAPQYTQHINSAPRHSTSVQRLQIGHLLSVLNGQQCTEACTSTSGCLFAAYATATNANHDDGWNRGDCRLFHNLVAETMTDSQSALRHVDGVDVYTQDADTEPITNWQAVPEASTGISGSDGAGGMICKRRAHDLASASAAVSWSSLVGIFPGPHSISAEPAGVLQPSHQADVYFSARLCPGWQSFVTTACGLDRCESAAGPQFGNAVLDGGSDMYDAGNLIMTSLMGDCWSSPHGCELGSISYDSAGAIRSSCFEPAGHYQTWKLSPALWMLLTENFDSVALDFIVLGNLGADGSGHVSVNTYSEAPFMGYGKATCGASDGDPSVNHLFIVDSSLGEPTLHSCDYSNGGPCDGRDANTDFDDDLLIGIPPGSAILYLLYSTQSCVKDDVHRALFGIAVSCLQATGAADTKTGAAILASIDVVAMMGDADEPIIAFGGHGSYTGWKLNGGPNIVDGPREELALTFSADQALELRWGEGEGAEVGRTSFTIDVWINVNPDIGSRDDGGVLVAATDYAVLLVERGSQLGAQWPGTRPGDMVTTTGPELAAYSGWSRLTVCFSENHTAAAGQPCEDIESGSAWDALVAGAAAAGNPGVTSCSELQPFCEVEPNADTVRLSCPRTCTVCDSEAAEMVAVRQLDYYVDSEFVHRTQQLGSAPTQVVMVGNSQNGRSPFTQELFGFTLYDSVTIPTSGLTDGGHRSVEGSRWFQIWDAADHLTLKWKSSDGDVVARLDESGLVQIACSVPSRLCSQAIDSGTKILSDRDLTRHQINARAEFDFGIGMGSSDERTPDACDSHSDCLAGHYCDNTNHCWECAPLGPTWCDAIDCVNQDFDAPTNQTCGCCEIAEVVAHCGEVASFAESCGNSSANSSAAEPIFFTMRRTSSDPCWDLWAGVTCSLSDWPTGYYSCLFSNFHCLVTAFP